MNRLRKRLGRLKKAAVGHSDGALHSVKCGIELAQHRRNCPRQLSIEVRRAAQRLRRDGALAVPTHYPADLIDYIQDLVELAEDPSISHAMGPADPEAVRYVEDPLKHAPRLQELLTPEILELVRGWYGTEFRIASVRLWRIAHIDDDDFRQTYHYGNLWHQDGHSLNTLKLFVQTTPGATSDGSAFRYLTRRDSRKAFLAGYGSTPEVSRAAVASMERVAQAFTGPPGSAALVDTNRCLHRAGNPADGRTRGMIQFMFDVADSEPLGGDYFVGVPKDANVYEGARV